MGIPRLLIEWYRPGIVGTMPPNEGTPQTRNIMKTYSKHTSLGSYPTFIVWEGECYCTDCANSFAEEEDRDEDMTEDDRIFSRPQEAGISEAINWENTDLYCSSMHGCGEQIEAAYQD